MSDRFDSVLAPITAVTRGLDPRVHHLREEHFTKKMDCRVKPGNDAEFGSIPPESNLVKETP
jgi:hypothetical protein